MAQECVSQRSMCVAGVYLHAQIDIALADLQQVHTRAQLARENLWLRTLHVDLGGVLHQRFGLQPATAAGKQDDPGRADNRVTPKPWILFVCSRVAAGFDHLRRRPLRPASMFTGTCVRGQSRIEKVGRVCSKSLIENTLSYDNRSERNPEVVTLLMDRIKKPT
jgi:hypothetical protein